MKVCSRDDIEVERRTRMRDRGRLETKMKLKTKLRPDERASEEI